MFKRHFLEERFVKFVVRGCYKLDQTPILSPVVYLFLLRYMFFCYNRYHKYFTIVIYSCKKWKKKQNKTVQVLFSGPNFSSPLKVIKTTRCKTSYITLFITVAETWDGIHNASKLTNGPYNLECYIAQGWKGLPGTNALAYQGHLWVMMKIMCCEYGSFSLRFEFGFIHNIQRAIFGGIHSLSSIIQQICDLSSDPKCRYEKKRCADAIVEVISLLTSFILLIALHFR